jgi:hypothetical protein
LPINFAELFPAEPLVESDYLRVSAGQGVDTLELFGKKDFYMAALSGQDTSAGASLLYCPQYATGGSWQTQLSIINLDAVPGAVTLEFFNDAGILQGQARILPIAPQGKLWISDPNFFVSSGGSLVQGYVKINGSGLKLTGSVLFADPQLESFAAALPLLAQFEPSAVLSQVASGKSWFTGVALLNAGDTAANLNLEVFDTQGAKVAGRQEILGPRQRGSQLLTQFFPELENRELSSGYVKIVSDRPIGLFAVYGTRDLSTLSAIPAQPIRF